MNPGLAGLPMRVAEGCTAGSHQPGLQEGPRAWLAC